jgi:Fe2+ or Zn2+ uptake regulation protein
LSSNFTITRYSITILGNFIDNTQPSCKDKNMIKKAYQTDLSILLENLFLTEPKPYSFNDLNDFLKSRGINCNKSTLYRQLQNLESRKLITSIISNHGQMWEKFHDHNHVHLLCKKCDDMKCFDIDQVLLDNINKMDTQFSINTVNLVGTCSKCLA